MKKTAAIISACMLTFALSACSGSNYVMHTNDGRTIVSDGKPQTDNDTGMISVSYTHLDVYKRQAEI